MGPTLFHLHAGPRAAPAPLSQDWHASAGEMAQGHTASHLTSKVGQPPDPCDWHLPLPSPLTELEGEQKEASGKSANGDRSSLQGFMQYPRPLSTPKGSTLQQEEASMLSLIHISEPTRPKR